MSNSQLNKLKSGTKYGTEITLKLSSSIVGDSNDKNYFPQKFLLPNTQFPKVRKAFETNSSSNIEFSKSQLHKIGQSVGLLGRILGTLPRTGLPLIGNVLKPLTKSIFIPIGLTAAESARDVVIHKKLFGLGVTTIIKRIFR